MRALCGAIITAGALLGLGLSAIGLGLRYQLYPYHNKEGKAQWVSFGDVDTGLFVIVVALLIILVLGLAVAFLGLAYHHHRRHLEIIRDHRPHGEPGTRVNVPS